MKLNTRTEKNPYAVVIGIDGINGLRAARTLSQHGIPVIGIAKDRRSYCCRTNICEDIIFTDTEDSELIETLENLGTKLSSKAVVFPCYDLSVLLVSRFRQRLCSSYHIMLPEPDVVEMLLHKTSFYAYCQKEGFPIPRTFMLNNRHDAEHATQELVFPCILKPAIRSKIWEENSKDKAYKSSTVDEFIALYERCAYWGEQLVVQEWVEGWETNLYTCYCYFSADSQPLVTFVTRKLRQWPPQTGDGCLGEECRNDIVLNETVRLFKSVGLRGLGYLEMKQDSRTKEYFIMEPNIGRPTSKSALAEAGGVELLYTMYCDALRWELPENRQQRYRGAKWIFLRRDLQSALYYLWKGELTIKEWLQSLRGIKVEALFSWTDLGPFLGDLLRALRLFLQRRWDKRVDN